MRRTPLLVAAVIALLALTVPVGLAGARPDLPSGTSPSLGRALVVRPLRLDCEVRATDADAIVRCRWSATDSTAAGVRLWRSDPTVDRREVIFRSDDTSITSSTDTQVRRGHRYGYVVQLVTASGRVLAQSRPSTVFVPPPASPSPRETDVEVLRLECELGPHHSTIGCAWSRPTNRAAEVVELWRSVDGGTRELVERFRPEGPTTYRDPVPERASRLAYAVLAKDAAGRLVGRSRADIVRIPDTRPVDTRPVDTRPVDTRPVATTVRSREGTAP